MYFVHPQFNKIKLFFKKISEANLKKKLAKFFPNHHIIFTDLGRSAFQLAIQNLKLENSEMLVPAYICDIFKPIFKKYNIKPVYLDIDLNTFNMQLSKIEKKITSNTKSILVSHTYGYPNDMNKIKQIAKKYNLKIIEDCARAFGVKYNDQYLGNFGDCSIFSLYKFLPIMNGGMLVCKKPINIKLKKYKIRLKDFIKFIRLFPVLATLTEKFRIKEKTIRTTKSSPPRKPPKLSLKVFNWYLDDFKNQNNERKELIDYFQKELGKINIKASKQMTYVSVLILNRDKMFEKLRKKKIYCSKTWHNPIYPYLPNTSIAASRIINLPFQSWFTKKDIDKIISCI